MIVIRHFLEEITLNTCNVFKMLIISQRFMMILIKLDMTYPKGSFFFNHVV